MIKKIVFLIIQLIITLNGNIYSQNRIFKPFKFDIAGLFDVSLDKESGNGGGFAIEPRYGVNDNFVVGVRVEGVYLNNSNVSVNLSGIDVNQSEIYNILFTGDCYLSYEEIRPFIGLGIGISTMKTKGVSVAINGINVGNSSVNKFDFSPRIGVNIKHFKFAVIFNISGKEIPNYAGIQAGVEIGGGYN